MNSDEMMSPQPENTKIGLKVSPAVNLQGKIAKAGAFLWHLAQMIVVMEAGMMVYMRLIRPLLASTPVSLLFSRYPLISYWLMVVSMVLPMLALMRLYHRSGWDNCLGMTLVMVAPTAALTLLVMSTLVSIHALYALGDPLMYAAMTAYMLFHLNMNAQPICC